MSDVEERARHRMLARTGDEADEHVAGILHDAAEHALHRGAVEVAAELAEQSARRTPSHIEVLWHRYLRAPRHYLTTGDPKRSKTLCEEVLGAVPPTLSPVRAHALGLLAEAQVFDRPAAAIPLIEEALACVGDDVVHRAQLEMSLGIVLASILQVERSYRHSVGAVELAERAGDIALTAEAIAAKANHGVLAGQGVDNSALERTLELENFDREVPFLMRVSLNVAQANEFIGRPDLARPLFANLRDRLFARGEETDLAWVLGHLAGTAWVTGDLEAAEREASDAERVAVLTGVEIFRGFALMMRAMVRAIRGNSGGARSDGTETIALSERIGWPIGVYQASWALGFLALSEADLEAAAALLTPVATAIEAIGLNEWGAATCQASRVTCGPSRFRRRQKRWAEKRKKASYARSLLPVSAGERRGGAIRVGGRRLA